MYNKRFGLAKNPFNMTPDPAFLFLTAQHREALAGLTYAVLQHKGFVVLTGEAGTGKTTLLSRVLQSLPESRIQFSLIMNSTLTPSEFLELALLDFGIKDVPASKAQRLHKLGTLLLQGQREGKVSALIVDEAHKLSIEVLEEIRLLGNFEQADQKLLQIVLVGQDELDEILDRANLRQLKQRIAVRLSIGPLAPPEVGQYIRHRWLTAGGTQPPFSAEAVAGIARVSCCIPRVINALCDNALVQAMAEGCATITDRHVHAAALDLQLAKLGRKMSAEPPNPEFEETNVSVPISAPTNGSSPEGSRFTKWVGKLGFRSGQGQL
jgi:general secretion pathway protein A